MGIRRLCIRCGTNYRMVDEVFCTACIETKFHDVEYLHEKLSREQTPRVPNQDGEDY